MNRSRTTLLDLRGPGGLLLGLLVASLLLYGCRPDPPTSAPSTPIPSTPQVSDQNGPQAGDHLSTAQRALEQGNLAVAEAEFRAVIEQDLQSAEARFGLGNVLIRSGKLQEAEAAYLASLELDPEQPAAHANLGVVYYQQGEMAKAAASFEQALRIDEQDGSTLYLLAAVRLQENDLEAAEPLLKEALRADPALPEPYYGLGVLYRLKGQKADAIAAFEKFLEIGPGQDASAVDQARRELEALRAE